MVSCILVNIGSDNGLPLVQVQAITQTNAGLSWIGPSGTHFNEISFAIKTFPFKKMHVKLSTVKENVGHYVAAITLFRNRAIDFSINPSSPHLLGLVLMPLASTVAAGAEALPLSNWAGCQLGYKYQPGSLHHQQYQETSTLTEETHHKSPAAATSYEGMLWCLNDRLDSQYGWWSLCLNIRMFWRDIH